MDTREIFKQNLCREIGINCAAGIGETDDMIVLSIKETDTETKDRIKQWMDAHHWVFTKNEIRDIPLIAGCPQAGSVRHHQVVYTHGSHKIIIELI